MTDININSLRFIDQPVGLAIITRGPLVAPVKTDLGRIA